MSSSEPALPGVESDERFPSGPWTGFFLQPLMPGKHWMELKLTFRDGIMDGEGRDRVGTFRIKGRYQVEDGKCWWTKTYVKRHALAYQGYNEGKGIWGTWEENAGNKGGFHIWPEGMADPTQAHLAEEADAPVSEVVVFEPEEVAEPVGAPAEVAEPAISSFSSPSGARVVLDGFRGGGPTGWESKNLTARTPRSPRGRRGLERAL